jgi:transposase
MMRQEVGRVSQRAHLVLLSRGHYTVPTLARLFAMSRATVRFWLRQFDAYGPPGLYDDPRSGRPPKVTPAVQETLVDLIVADPQDHGYLATIWTVGMLVLGVITQLGVHRRPSSLRHALHRLDLRWGRPRLAMPRKSDPEKAVKQWAIALAAVDAAAGTPILYADESRVQLLPLLRAMWHWVGQQLRIPTPGTNVTRAIFGALNIDSGQWTDLIRDRMRADDFVVFLEHLLDVYPVGPILLIVDNDSNHTAGVVRTWLTMHPRIRLYFLPKYCSHLNPVEPIWRRLKDKVAADRLYDKITTLIGSVDAFFRAMTPEQALVWAAE